MPPVANGEADCGVNVGLRRGLSTRTAPNTISQRRSSSENLQAWWVRSCRRLVSMYVRTDSDVQTLADHAGPTRIPSGLNAQLAIGAIYETYLDFAGLTR